MTNFKRLESSYSGNFINTEFGKLTQTNGYFEFSNIPKIFYFSNIPDNLVKVIRKGTPATTSIIEIDVQGIIDHIKNLEILETRYMKIGGVDRWFEYLGNEKQGALIIRERDRDGNTISYQ